jgi:hypothetical protein
LRDLQSFGVNFAEFMTLAGLRRGENKMSNAYAAVSAFIFTIVAVAHLVRIVQGWSAVVGPYNVSMNVSWGALVVAALLAIWGFVQLG